MTFIVIFNYHLVNWCKFQIHAVARPSDFMWVSIHQAKQEKVYIQEQLKLIHINVSTLNSHITIIYLRFIKNNYLYTVKQKNWKQLYWIFSNKKIYNKMTSARKSYISKSFQSLEISWLLTKNLKQSYYRSADSFIENNLYNDFRVKIILWLSGKLFISKKTSFQYYRFSVEINEFL